jgi:hypothetical protein
MAQPSRETLTPEEAAERLWVFLRNLSRASHDEFLSMLGEGNVKLDKSQELAFARELLIINFWLAAKALGQDREVLDCLHALYANGHANLSDEHNQKNRLIAQAKDEMLERYQQYHEKWNHADTSNQSLLVSVMAHNLIRDDAIERNPIIYKLYFNLRVHISASIQSLWNLRSNLDVRKQ